MSETGAEMSESRMDELEPLKKDLALWINKVLGITCVTPSKFFDELDNGVTLCLLAQVVQARANIAASKYSFSIPFIRSKIFSGAVRGSFFARDNIDNFISFCRSLGVHDNLLFESDDLVLQHNLRNVIMCLMEVARLSAQYGIAPLSLAHLDKKLTEECVEEIEKQDVSGLSWQFRALAPIEAEPIKFSGLLTPISGSSCCSESREHLSLPVELPSAPEPEVKKSSLKEALMDKALFDANGYKVNALDQKIQCAAITFLQHIHEKLKIRKITNQLYNIGGKNVLVRLLNDKQMMVRVGGGWEALDHFLLRHITQKECKKEYCQHLHNPLMLSKRYTYYSKLLKTTNPGETTV